MPAARPLQDLRTVFVLKSEGFTDREISHRTRVPINTIRRWRNGRLPGYAVPHVCSGRCRVLDTTKPDLAQLPTDSYAYLPGIYLGDGCLTQNGRSWTLRVVLDEAYPGIVSECCDAIELMRGVRPRHDVTPVGHGASTSSPRGTPGFTCSLSTLRARSMIGRSSSRTGRSASCTQHRSRLYAG
jgi:hypothetical protein